MSKLLWDQPGDRLYESGIDRGVLYLTDNTGVSWNGLTSLDEDLSEENMTPIYIDGMKISGIPGFSDYSANLKAFTYPDEFLEFDGVFEDGDGLFIDGQPSKQFGLSYRTLVGSDLDSDLGYRIHILYNLMALSSDLGYETISEKIDPMEFSWTITGVPKEISGYRPTAHVILDSRYMSVLDILYFEGILYGSDIDAPRIPTPAEIIEGFDRVDIVEDPADPGTYLVYNNTIEEDPTDPGTYIINGDTLVESVSDPGVYNSHFFPEFIIVMTNPTDDLPYGTEEGALVFVTSNNTVYSYGSPSGNTREVFVIPDADPGSIPPEALTGDFAYVEASGILYKIGE